MQTVNLEYIKETTLGDAEFMAELIDIYLDDTPPHLVQLRAAVAASDAAVVRSVAHRLKGSSGNIGAESLSALCAEIERAGRQSRVEEISHIVPRVEEEFSRVQDCLLRLKRGAP